MLWFHRKKKFVIPDKYSVHLTFDEGFAPANNDAMQQIIDDLSAAESQEGKPVLADTLPFASLEAAEDLFEKISTEFYQNADLLKTIENPDKGVPFEEVAIWEFDQSKKVNHHNPHEFIKIANFAVNEDWQNLTKPLFEEVFTNPENADFDYDTKKQICADFGQVYQEAVGVDDQQIATIPEEADINAGTATFDVPALSDSEPIVQNEVGPDDEEETVDDIINGNTDIDDSSDQRSSTVYYDPNTSTFSNQQPADNSNSNDNNFEPTNDQSTEKQDSERPLVSATKASRAERSAITNQTQGDQQEMLSKGEVEAPLFDIEEIEQVGPADDRYVAYMLNQKAKTFNRQLQELARKLTSGNYEALTKLSSRYSDAIDKAERDYWLSHGEDLKKVAEEVIGHYQKLKKQRLTKEMKENDKRRQEDIADAKKVYDESVKKINREASHNADAISKRIEQSFHDQALAASSKAQDKKAQELDIGKSKVRADNTRKFNAQLQADAGSLVSEAAKMLKEQFDLNAEALDEYRTKVTSEHLAAVRDQAKVIQAEAEKNRLISPQKELREATKDLTSTKTENAKLLANVQQLEKANADYKAQLETLSSRNKQLVDERAAASKLAIANDVQSKSNGDDLINQYLKMQIAQSLKPTDNKQNPELDKAQKQLANSQAAFRGLKRLTTGVAVLFLLAIGGGCWYGYQQQKANNARISALQSQLTKKPKKQVSKVKVTKPTDTAAKATTALHANDQKQLDRYSSEPYYDLDKAIIGNDDKAVDTAAQKLASYDLHDSYRATQTVNLLNKAGNHDLANKIADANK